MSFIGRLFPFEPHEIVETKENTMPEKHGIGWAVKQLYDGRLVCREGWNGREMYLTLIREYAVPQIVLAGGRLLPWIGMRTAQGDFVPWLASQTDILATDWQVVE